MGEIMLSDQGTLRAGPTRTRPRAGGSPRLPGVDRPRKTWTWPGQTEPTGARDRAGDWTWRCPCSRTWSADVAPSGKPERRSATVLGHQPGYRRPTEGLDARRTDQRPGAHSWWTPWWTPYRYLRQRELTVLLVEQRLEVAQAVSDVVLVLSHGRVVAPDLGRRSRASGPGLRPPTCRDDAGAPCSPKRRRWRRFHQGPH